MIKKNYTILLNILIFCVYLGYKKSPCFSKLRHLFPSSTQLIKKQGS